MDYPSAKTRERAYTLIKNANDIGVDVDKRRYAINQDYIFFWFTNMVDYVVVYCTPLGYLAELYNEQDGVLDTTYIGIRNIRHFLQHLKRDDYKGTGGLLRATERDLEEDEMNLKEYLDDNE